MHLYVGVVMKGNHTSHVHDVALDLPLDMGVPHASHDHSHHYHDDDKKVIAGSGISSWIK